MSTLRFAPDSGRAAQCVQHCAHALRFAVLPVLLVAAGQVLPAQAKPSSWTATVTDEGVSAANCSDCDENISILITCQRGQDMREIHVMILEQRDDSLAGKQANILAKSNGGAMALTGTYSNPGEAGPYPVLTVSKTDPVFEFLSHADTVRLAANGQNAKVSMRNSKQAIAKMNAACR